MVAWQLSPFGQEGHAGCTKKKQDIGCNLELEIGLHSRAHEVCCNKVDKGHVDQYPSWGWVENSFHHQSLRAVFVVNIWYPHANCYPNWSGQGEENHHHCNCLRLEFCLHRHLEMSAFKSQPRVAETGYIRTEPAPRPEGFNAVLRCAIRLLEQSQKLKSDVIIDIICQRSWLESPEPRAGSWGRRYLWLYIYVLLLTFKFVGNQGDKCVQKRDQVITTTIWIGQTSLQESPMSINHYNIKFWRKREKRKKIPGKCIHQGPCLQRTDGRTMQPQEAWLSLDFQKLPRKSQ